MVRKSAEATAGAEEMVDGALKMKGKTQRKSKGAAEEAVDSPMDVDTMGDDHSETSISAGKKVKGKETKVKAVKKGKKSAAKEKADSDWEMQDAEDDQASEEKPDKSGSRSGGYHAENSENEDDEKSSKKRKRQSDGKSGKAAKSSKQSNGQPTSKNQPQEGRSKDESSQEMHTEKPSAVFKPRKARSWTASMALPGSILMNVAKPETRTLLASRIARAAAVWCIDEIVIYDEDPTNISDKVNDRYKKKGLSKEEIMDSISDDDIPYQNPDRFLAGLLEYVECPPYLRYDIYPMCEPLRHAGLMAPLDTPSHVKAHEWIRFREGIALAPPQRQGKSRYSAQKQTQVKCGLPYPVFVSQYIPPDCRLTLEFKDEHPPPSWPNLSAEECANLEVGIVTSADPREKAGYYWGYSVRRAPNISSIYTECPFPGGYDFAIGTSERGVPLSSVLPDRIAPTNRRERAEKPLPDAYKHFIVVFGGVAGLEPVVANDPELKEEGLTKETASMAFDWWVNLVEGQGSRTIRTEEAIEIGLCGLKPYMDYQFDHLD